MHLQEHCLLKNYSTFKIGGPARYFIEVRTQEALREAFAFCKEKKIVPFILGKGSNTLFDDEGFHGAVILNKIDFIEHPEPGIYTVGAGYSFSLLGAQTAREQWSGLEFASGIPGSVGGAVFMNAGANGVETCESLHSVNYMDFSGRITTWQKKDLMFSYRSSPFQHMQGAIVSATFVLQKSQGARQRQLEIIDYRKKTQPLQQPSVGCIFRNPEFGPAGKLIEECGLKGLSIGGAQVSLTHANFIVNIGGATTRDVLSLIDLITKKVYETRGIDLENEVRYVAPSPAESA